MSETQTEWIIKDVTELEVSGNMFLTPFWTGVKIWVENVAGPQYFAIRLPTELSLLASYIYK